MQLLFGKNCVSETAKHTFFGIWLEYRPIYRIPGLYCTRTRARLIRARSVNAAGDVRIETWRPSIQLLLYSENDDKRRSMAKILILYVENQMAVSEFRPQNDNSHQHTCMHVNLEDAKWRTSFTTVNGHYHMQRKDVASRSTRPFYQTSDVSSYITVLCVVVGCKLQPVILLFYVFLVFRVHIHARSVKMRL